MPSANPETELVVIADKTRLDLNAVIQFLKQTHWAKDTPVETIKKIN